VFCLIEYMFYLCCIIVMMYQFIEITDYYLSFAIEVNIIIKIKDTIDLPQMCHSFWQEFDFDFMEKEVHLYWFKYLSID